MRDGDRQPSGGGRARAQPPRPRRHALRRAARGERATRPWPRRVAAALDRVSAISTRPPSTASASPSTGSAAALQTCRASARALDQGRPPAAAAARPGARHRPMFAESLPFEPVFDYSYDGTMRSLEDSRQRLGLAAIDIALIHDLNPRWHGDDLPRRFDEAMAGAYRALDELRRAGDIKAIGVGVNDSQACLDLAARRPLRLLHAGRPLHPARPNRPRRACSPTAPPKGSASSSPAPSTPASSPRAPRQGATFFYDPAEAEIVERTGGSKPSAPPTPCRSPPPRCSSPPRPPGHHQRRHRLQRPGGGSGQYRPYPSAGAGRAVDRAEGSGPGAGGGADRFCLTPAAEPDRLSLVTGSARCGWPRPVARRSPPRRCAGRAGA